MAKAGKGKKSGRKKEKRVVEKLTGARRPVKKAFEYEIKWENLSHDLNEWWVAAGDEKYQY